MELKALESIGLPTHYPQNGAGVEMKIFRGFPIVAHKDHPPEFYHESKWQSIMPISTGGKVIV